MADAGDDTSSTGSNDGTVTEDEIQYTLAEEAGPSVQKLTGPDPDEVLTPLRLLDDSADQLCALLNGRRWLQTADHVAKCLLFHKGQPEHPEFIVLLRRQHVLELLGEGKLEEAQDCYSLSRSGPSRHAHRTPHLDALISSLGDVIATAAAAPPPGAQPADLAAAATAAAAAAPPPPPGGQQPADWPLDLRAERRKTVGCVWNYLRVYYPDFDRGIIAAAWMEESRNVLYAAAPFGEVLLGERQYRCLVCHQVLSFHNVPDQRLTEHLHNHCPAVTPALRGRLPRPNRPPWHNAPPVTATAAAKRGRRK